MSEAKSQHSSTSSSDKDVKAPNVFERFKEEFEAAMHRVKHSHHHQKETHGLRVDIDENTPISDVKAPNVFERTKEEIEALFQAIHPKKEDHSHGSASDGENRTNGTNAELKTHDTDSPSEDKVDVSNQNKRAEEEKSPHRHHHHKETHGRNDDIDDDTPISEIKAPNIFERAKEEIEALVHSIHPKK